MKIHITILSIILLSIAANIFGLLWLTISILVLGLLLLFGTVHKSIAEFLPLKKIRILMWLFVSVIVPVVLLRLFVFEIFKIPSSSMENTLIPGDRIVVNKLRYGPALPRSPLDIPWFKAFFLLNRKAKAKDAELEWEYHRLPGMQKIERGDVLVFRYPLSPFQNFVKRCVALPGDTIQITNEILYINGRQQNFPGCAKIEYKVWLKNCEIFNALQQRVSLPEPNTPYCDSLHYCTMSLTADELDNLQLTGLTDSVHLHVLGDKHTVPSPPYPSTVWTPDNFGPFVVPRKGTVMPVNEKALILYKTALQKYEHLNPQKKNGEFVHNGKQLNHHTFKQDYYFMMGDNRHNSTDSRVWGAVPEELITGKATRVLWSSGYRGFRWNRIFRRVQ